MCGFHECSPEESQQWCTGRCTAETKQACTTVNYRPDASAFTLNSSYLFAIAACLNLVRILVRQPLFHQNHAQHTVLSVIFSSKVHNRCTERFSARYSACADQRNNDRVRVGPVRSIGSGWDRPITRLTPAIPHSSQSDLATALLPSPRLAAASTARHAYSCPG